VNSYAKAGLAAATIATGIAVGVVVTPKPAVVAPVATREPTLFDPPQEMLERGKQHHQCIMACRGEKDCLWKCRR
jgi:hypothetical protein